MKQTLLRGGGALAFLSAILPATAGAHAGVGTSTNTPAHEKRIAMPSGWSAGDVHRWTGYSRPGGSRRVRELQRRLNRLGYESGPVDGLFGALTERATRHFQERHGLRVDGVAGPRTLRRLRERDARRRASRRTPPAGARTPAGETRPAQPREPRTPQAVPQDQTPEVQARAPATPGPELPLVPVLIALGVLGLATFAVSYVRTAARIRHSRGDPGRLGATPRHEGGGE